VADGLAGAVALAVAVAVGLAAGLVGLANRPDQATADARIPDAAIVGGQKVIIQIITAQRINVRTIARPEALGRADPSAMLPGNYGRVAWMVRRSRAGLPFVSCWRFVDAGSALS
jgi:hypothetical protein